MPAHIVRNIVGFRETPFPNRFTLAPGFGSKLNGAGKRYRLEHFSYASHVVDLDFLFSDEHSLLISLTVLEGSPSVSVSDASGTPLKIKREGPAWQFEAKNFAVYELELGSGRPQMTG